MTKKKEQCISFLPVPVEKVFFLSLSVLIKKRIKRCNRKDSGLVYPLLLNSVHSGNTTGEKVSICDTTYSLNATNVCLYPSQASQKEYICSSCFWIKSCHWLLGHCRTLSQLALGVCGTAHTLHWTAQTGGDEVLTSKTLCFVAQLPDRCRFILQRQTPG